MLRTKRQQKQQASSTVRNGRDVTVLTAAELKTIASLLRDEGDVAATAEAAVPAMSEAALARRKRMEAIDSQRKAAGARRDRWEEDDDVKREQIKARAERMRLEETDEVKAMNSIINAAKIGAVRDAQVRSKQQIAAERADAERAAEDAIEGERVRALRLYEEREVARAAAQRRGAAVLRQQIAEVEQQRRKELERKALDQELLVAAMARTRAEERAAVESRRVAAKQLQLEVAQANKRAIEAKALALEAEKEDAVRIRKWTEEREARDLAIAAEEERLRVAKEREVARLRGQQQRVLDTRAQLDELRARRHQDEKAREQMAREAADAKRRSELNAELERSRAQQLAVKNEQRAREREEDERAREQARILSEEIDVFERQRHVLSVVTKKKQAEALQAQIRDRRKALRESRLTDLESSKLIQREVRGIMRHWSNGYAMSSSILCVVFVRFDGMLMMMMVGVCHGWSCGLFDLTQRVTSGGIAPRSPRTDQRGEASGARRA